MCVMGTSRPDDVPVTILETSFANDTPNSGMLLHVGVAQEARNETFDPINGLTLVKRLV